MSTLAIDPGPTESGWCIIDDTTRRPLAHGKTANHVLLDALASLSRRPIHGHDPIRVVIEMVASYGMAVGEDVFNTCVWIGRFQEAVLRDPRRPIPQRIKRLPVKLHHCHDSRAKDSNIIQALVDRFAPGEPNRGKGTKAEPGWFYGFAGDVWQAYALAVYAVDVSEPGQP